MTGHELGSPWHQGRQIVCAGRVRIDAHEHVDHHQREPDLEERSFQESEVARIIVNWEREIKPVAARATWLSGCVERVFDPSG